MDSLIQKFNLIKSNLSNQPSFFFDDIARLFPDMKDSSLYWLVSKLVSNGFLIRQRKGRYSINEWKEKKRVSITGEAKRLCDKLIESGFDFFISGLDVLSAYMHHIPEQYPIILFADKASIEEITKVCKKNNYMVTYQKQFKEQYKTNIYSGIKETLVLVYLTENFEFAKNGIASLEKAFIDLYYAITRNDYPVSLQELAKIYLNLIRLGNIDTKKLISIASKRSIQFDIRYIVESKYITQEAENFVNIIKKEGLK